MKSVIIILLITFTLAIFFAFFFRSKQHGKHALYIGKKPTKKKKKKPRPIDRSKLMGPDNPHWVKIYAEEMAKRNTAQTTAVVKKWLKEE